MSNLVNAIAQHFYEVHYGNNWTDASVNDAIKDISWEQATKQLGSVNTIALLVHHMHFYNSVVYNRCFEDEDKEFDHEDSLVVNVQNQKDWEQLKATYFELVSKLNTSILNLREDVLFTKRLGNEKTYYKNLHGLIEHIHYHLGQINLLKKMLSAF